MTEDDETYLKTCELRKQAEASHARVVARWEAATAARNEACEVMEEAKEAYENSKRMVDKLMREVNESRLCYYAFIEAEKIALSATQPETCERNG